MWSATSTNKSGNYYLIGFLSQLSKIIRDIEILVELRGTFVKNDTQNSENMAKNKYFPLYIDVKKCFV